MADLQLAAALKVMHTQFQRTWTVTELASASGMSRSVFAERFNRVVGLAPIDYLRELRMAVQKTRFFPRESEHPKSPSFAVTSPLLRLVPLFDALLVRHLLHTPNDDRLDPSDPTGPRTFRQDQYEGKQRYAAYPDTFCQ